MQNYLKMICAIFYESLYCQFEYGQLVGINGSYVDNFLRAGTSGWKTHSNATLEKLETFGNKQAPFTFAEMHIT